MRYVAYIILIFAIFTGANTAVQGQSYLSQHAFELTASAGPSDEVRNMLDSVSPAVVKIEAYEDVPIYAQIYELRPGRLLMREEELGTAKIGIGNGSGFFVTPDGYILTNRHVVDDASAQYVVDAGQREYLAQVVYRDPTHDVAVLKVDGSGFPALSMGGPAPLKSGSTVIAFGNALGRYEDSASIGRIISTDEDIMVSTARSGPADGKLSDLIQTSAKVFPGDSGGPLLDERGEVIGINVATAIGEWVGYAVPIEAGKTALQKALTLNN